MKSKQFFATKGRVKENNTSSDGKAMKTLKTCGYKNRSSNEMPKIFLTNIEKHNNL